MRQERKFISVNLKIGLNSQQNGKISYNLKFFIGVVTVRKLVFVPRRIYRSPHAIFSL